ncbi:tetratricopeptide repeat protein [uncultured Helicobacter sp.]|uniref:tetratricopeptide repeat protein n=1 Tax=uncultured Helicobacter sp. TaxID=175537 RepID=UPI0037511938
MQWYQDPLFGIILVFVIIAIVGALDFIRNRIKERKRVNSLEDLKKSYEFLGIKDGVEEFLKLNKNAIPTLEFIANAYIQSGNIQEAIKIYTSILNATPSTSTQDKVHILYALGMVHFQSGFLQRAKNVFLEIVKNFPRNPEALFYLLRIYEKLNEYEKAIDVVDCLQEIYEQSGNLDDTKYFETLSHNRAYLESMCIFADEGSAFEDKVPKLEALKTIFPRLEKPILMYYRNYNLALFWQKAQEARNIENLLDVLWHCPKSEVPLESLTNQKIIEIYRAREQTHISYESNKQECAKFELETLRLLRAYSHFSVDLHFEYRCSECKGIFPLENQRCPTCNALLSFDVLCSVRESKDEIRYSLL